MANVSVVQSVSGNGTTTPATVSLTGVTAGDFLICLIGCVGSTATSIATPTGDSWASIQNQAGSGSGVPSFGMFVLPNAGAGSHTPSAVLTGTLTGWVIAVFELSNIPTTLNTFSSSVLTNNVAQLANIFAPNLGQATPATTYMYAVLRTGNTTISGAVAGLNNWAPPGYPPGASSWSASLQPLANVQGLSLDTYFGATNNAWPCAFPVCAGLLSAAVNSVQMKLFLFSQATQPDTAKAANIGGLQGSYVGPFHQGMIGG